MGFTRQIELKTSSLLRRNALRSVLATLTILICGLLVTPSLYAGCSDYVILTGEIPAHLRPQHDAHQAMLLQQIPHELNEHSLFSDLLTPRVPQPCHGPSCGQNRSPAMATTVPIPADDQINLFCTSDSDTQRINRDGRYSLFSQPLLSSDHCQRIDRPPRV